MKLELTEQEVKTVMIALGELKAKEVFNLIVKLQKQLSENTIKEQENVQA